VVLALLIERRVVTVAVSNRFDQLERARDAADWFRGNPDHP
jgi:hypothetical protein